MFTDVTSDTKSWTYAKTIQFGEKASYTFKKPGTYKYECTLHPGMIGQITVIKRAFGKFRQHVR